MMGEENFVLGSPVFILGGGAETTKKSEIVMGEDYRKRERLMFIV